MTEIDIVNKALLKLGQEPIISFYDENERAKAANVIYESIRDLELSTYRWSFAIRRIALEECHNKPDFGFEKQYPLPPNFLRFLYIEGANPNDVDNYSIENNHILCNYDSPLKIIYLERVTEPELFPPYFCEVLACKLAFELCERLKQDPARKQVLMSEYQFALSNAKKTNAIQMASQRMPNSRLITARFGGY